MYNMYDSSNSDSNSASSKKDPNVDKWVGKVLGDEEEIKEALKRLEDEPRDLNELQQVIFKLRKEDVHETTIASTKGYY